MYLVQEAFNGIEACIILGKDLPDLLILDVMMPGINGAEVCRTIKRKPSLSGPPGYCDHRIHGITDCEGDRRYGIP